MYRIIVRIISFLTVSSKVVYSRSALCNIL